MRKLVSIVLALNLISVATVALTAKDYTGDFRMTLETVTFTQAQEAIIPARQGNWRIATFNACLNRTSKGEILDNLAAETPDSQAAAVDEIIQRIRPDILLLNKFD